MISSILETNELNNIYHQIIIKLKILFSNDSEASNFLHLPLLIIETVEDLTRDQTVTSQDKLSLAKDVLEYCLVKSNLKNIEKDYLKMMFPLMIESLISISNKKYRLYKRGQLDKVQIFDEIYNQIRATIYNNFNLQEFTESFFKIILIIIDKVNDYKNILNHQKKVIVLSVINQIINKIYEIYNYCTTTDVNRIIFFNKFTSSYIDNVFNIYKNRSRLNTHKQIFKSLHIKNVFL